MSNGFQGIGGRRIRGYTLQGAHLALNPVDSSVYYFGSLPGLATSTTPDLTRLYIPQQGIVRGVINFWSAVGTAGSAEEITVALRHNNLVDYLVATVANTSANKIFRNLAMNIPVKAGVDYVEVKMTVPAFATNPTNVRNAVVIFVET